MSAHPPLALAAATLVAFVLLLRWGATHRSGPGRHRDGVGGPHRPGSRAGDVGAAVASPGPGDRVGSAPPVARAAVGRGAPAPGDAERRPVTHRERPRSFHPHVRETAARDTTVGAR
ncbi:hypothetical protein [Streptomyces hilarionis]|uniref:hypothetical protein n=1 Tax=Streptomyces hilarionis TaxID=2839954 RepID=UPI002119FE3C|nr:hypothetical protein [Streptomyces hilarionis]MCQ9135606.1 hypothetical protein [Streptomyces hilarionis]